MVGLEQEVWGTVSEADRFGTTILTAVSAPGGTKSDVGVTGASGQSECAAERNLL